MSGDIQKVESSNGQIAQNVHGDMIYADGDIHIHNSKNKSINKIKEDFFDVRLKLNLPLCKILLALNFVLLIVSVIIFKLLKTDSCFELLTSSFIALLLSIVYYIFNKAYYKEYQTQNDEISTSDKFTVLFIIDILMFGSLFWIYS